MKLKLLLLVFFFSCAVSQKYSKTNFLDEYRPGHYLANCRAWNYSTDSSRIYINIIRDHVLFKNTENQFLSSFSIKYILSREDNPNSIYDSSTVYFNLPIDSASEFITIEKNIHASFGFNYRAKILLTDFNRNVTESAGLIIKKVDKQSEQFFNYSPEMFPVKNVIRLKEQVTISAPDSSRLFARCFFRNYPLALPPFSNAPMPKFDYHSDSTFIVSHSRNFHFSPERSGIYFFQYDTLSTNGFAVYVANENYPEFTFATELIESLRYLCTRKEYDSLMSASDRKSAVDQYWLEKSGNNERARKLIKIYYGRAREANTYFTSFLEGWKTDRGMIYMIFGPPASVTRDPESETWIYNFSGNMPDATFVFNKIRNPFTANDYQLERNEIYKEVWYMAVDNWRSARIVGEY
jgi:GWxTD domain-containing protein